MSRAKSPSSSGSSCSSDEEEDQKRGLQVAGSVEGVIAATCVNTLSSLLAQSRGNRAELRQQLMQQQQQQQQHRRQQLLTDNDARAAPRRSPPGHSSMSYSHQAPGSAISPASPRLGSLSSHGSGGAGSSGAQSGALLRHCSGDLATPAPAPLLRRTSSSGLAASPLLPGQGAPHQGTASALVGPGGHSLLGSNHSASGAPASPLSPVSPQVRGGAGGGTMRRPSVLNKAVSFKGGPGGLQDTAAGVPGSPLGGSAHGSGAKRLPSFDMGSMSRRPSMLLGGAGGSHAMADDDEHPRLAAMAQMLEGCKTECQTDGGEGRGGLSGVGSTSRRGRSNSRLVLSHALAPGSASVGAGGLMYHAASSSGGPSSGSSQTPSSAAASQRAGPSRSRSTGMLLAAAGEDSGGSGSKGGQKGFSWGALRRVVGLGAAKGSGSGSGPHPHAHQPHHQQQHHDEAHAAPPRDIAEYWKALLVGDDEVSAALHAQAAAPPSATTAAPGRFLPPIGKH